MTDIVTWAALAPFIALAGALINGLFGRSLKEPLPGWIASGAVGIGFFFSLIAYFGLLGREEKSVHVPLWDYLSAGGFDLNLGFTIDTLSVTMMLIITGVGLLIHIYSIAYMHGDEGFSRYFSNLNLFIAAMLILVMADSFFLMFIGWEGVGVCSFLLIGFWYSDKLNADAARKAFIVNRIGDVGFLLAMFLTFKQFGTLNIAAVNEAVGGLVAVSGIVTVIGLLYLLAACGKSAQLPLHVWLPDAMAGPTPVSALIHAATMVTAGVYLIARAAPLFRTNPCGLYVSLPGSVHSRRSWRLSPRWRKPISRKFLPIRRFRNLAICLWRWVVARTGSVFFTSLRTPFSKRCLFLGSGSVIHALGGEQDVRKMGGLGKHMKVTGTTSLIATLAIAGVPFLSGFFSKDAILAHAFNSELNPGIGNYLLYAILLVTAVLTAFYMFRWYYTVFAGEERMSEEAKAHVHESPRLMTVPLVILAFFSIFAGYFGMPEFAFPNVFAHWIEVSTEAPVSFAHPALVD